MNWIGVLFVSPAWAILSSWFFVQSWLSLVRLSICLLGVLVGRVPRSDNLIGASASVAQVVIFSSLLVGGYYGLTHLLHFGYSRLENVVYWVFAVPSFVFSAVQGPAILKKTWLDAMVPGALDTHMLEEQMKRR